MQLAAAFAATLAALGSPRPFALAVSGGPDSMALMRLAAPFKPVVLTVDHGLRDASAGEAAQVAAWASDLGLDSRSRRWEGSKPSSGIQAAARRARYRLLADMSEAAGARSLLTGHTLDDQAETVAMRAARGSGALGLAGMPTQAMLPGHAIRLVRPLLATHKAVLVSFLERLGQGFLVDPSNHDPRFDRGRLRLSQCGTIDLKALVSAQETRAALEREALDLLTAKAALLPGGRWRIARSVLADLPGTMADIVIAALLRRVGGRDYPGTAAERARVIDAIRAKAAFSGRTLASTVVRRATGAENDLGGEPGLIFEAESTPLSGPGAWWLPFAEFPQLLADGRVVQASTLLANPLLA